MDWTDERWNGLLGGYRIPYDPRPTLKELLNDPGCDQLWLALWEDLYHQGDVGEASYASVSVLAQIASADPAGDWNPYALAASIEQARWSGSNPSLPDWMAPEYAAAWQRLFGSAMNLLERTDSETVVASTLAVIAIHKGQKTLGRMAMLTEDERKEMLDEVGWG